MTVDPNIYQKIQRIAKASGFTLSKRPQGVYTLVDGKTGASVEEQTLQDVAVRLQRMGVLGYGK